MNLSSISNHEVRGSGVLLGLNRKYTVALEYFKNVQKVLLV